MKMNHLTPAPLPVAPPSHTRKLTLPGILAERVPLNKARCTLQLLYACVLLAFVIPVRATTLVYKSFDDLVKEADGIVVGTVTNVEARKDARGNIYTYVTLSDLQFPRARYNQQTFTLFLEGGQVGNDTVDVEGSPHFTPNERVILFVKGNGREIVPLVGWSQGVFRVQTDPSSGQHTIADSEGNRVFAIENGHLVKERRVLSQADIVGQPPRYRHSEPFQGGAGTTEKGEAAKALSNNVSLTDRKPMRLEDFTKEILQRSSALTAVPAPLVSINTSPDIRVPSGEDARPKNPE